MDFFTKENIMLIMIVVLFLWKVVDFVIKIIKKREHERERLAFDMAKLWLDASPIMNENILKIYFYYLEMLKNRCVSDAIDKLEDLADNVERKTEILRQLEEKLEKNEKIPSGIFESPKWYKYFFKRIKI